jgi:3',5'-cyclic-nucleotide phosphodiesterase
VDLRVIGCHGGETPKHRTSAFVVDDRLALDAGSLTSGLDLKGQTALEAVLVSHAHLDHVRDLATIADNRFQKGALGLRVVGTKPTLAALRKHFFNGILWPDFTQIPSRTKPTIELVEVKPNRLAVVAGYEVRAIPVTHSIDCCGFTVAGRHGTIAYSGDTGPTEELWTVLNKTPDLRALLVEVSFPNAQHRLAKVSGHYTPETLAKDLGKLERRAELPMLLYHIKPAFQSAVERECARLKGFNLDICSLGDQFIL